jgi:hypothetical protein
VARQGSRKPDQAGSAGYVRALAYPYTLGRDYRTEGLRAARAGSILLRSNGREAEKMLRSALRDLVNAFLTDRQSNRSLFMMAHRVGETLERNFGCRLEYDPAIDCYWDSCPVHALHSRIGSSVAMTISSDCSICGAGEFACDHVPGRSYGDRLCYRASPRVVALREVSLTPNPDFQETFATVAAIPRHELEATHGRRIKPGTALYSNHCRDCSGTQTPDDLDPSRWPRVVLSD